MRQPQSDSDTAILFLFSSGEWGQVGRAVTISEGIGISNGNAVPLQRISSLIRVMKWLGILFQPRE